MFGWGDPGHRLVGDVAEKALGSNSAALAEVHRVFGPSVRLRDLATCADRLRDFVRSRPGAKLDAACAPLINKFAATGELKAKYPHSDKWHFVNIPVDGGSHSLSDVKSFCGPESCAAAEIARFTAQLTPTASQQDKAEAILFLAHLVGDIHQPLHSADRNGDGGANSVHVTFFGDSMTLHHLWDTEVLSHSTVDTLSATSPAPGSTDPWQWALDAYARAVDTAYKDASDGGNDIPPSGEILDSGSYEQAADPVVQRQILLAGVRLAQILSSRLVAAPANRNPVAPPPPPPPPPTGDSSSHTHNATEFLPPAMTKSAGCKVNGALPDPSCTPGAAMGITTTEVCTTGTKGRRAVTTEMKHQVYASYGLTPQPEGTYEVDHFIPLELGGSNDLANLWPEAANPKPGFREKDCVENYLHAQVCTTKTMTLAEAQRAISTNWLDVYNTKAKASCKR